MPIPSYQFFILEICNGAPALVANSYTAEKALEHCLGEYATPEAQQRFLADCQLAQATPDTPVGPIEFDGSTIWVQWGHDYNSRLASA